MRSAQSWFDDYGESHQNPVNKAIHWICVPAILFTVIALLWSVPVPGWMQPLNWAIVVVVLAQLWYFATSPVIGFGMLVVNVFFLWLSWRLEQWGIAPLWQIAVVIFVVAWIGQFIGHHIEGKKPSFFKDLQFLLIGPAWLLSFVYQKLGISY
jgi:uncharacterized membrane protein YGL010W